MAKNINYIAYFCPSLSWGGLEMNQLRNAVWMKERGHKVIMIGLKDSRFLKEAECINIDVAFVNKHKKYYDFKNAINLKRIIKSKAITHLILRDPKDISLGVTTKRLMSNQLFLAYFMEMQLGVKKNDFIHTWRFKGLDLWSCPLHFLANQVEELTNFPASKTKVIPSALDLSKFDKLVDKNTARAKLNLPDDQIILGIIGRFDPFKGHKLLMDAYESLPLMLRNKLTLVFLGEKTIPDVDNFHDYLLGRIKEDIFNNNVFILPFRKDIETYFAAIDVFVMASKAETFGMVTIESMASGTPVIGSNAGGTPELLGNGSRGVLFETMNTESLANAIHRFVNNYKYEEEYLKSYVQKYSHDRVCQQVEKYLKLK